MITTDIYQCRFLCRKVLKSAGKFPEILFLFGQLTIVSFLSIFHEYFYGIMGHNYNCIMLIDDSELDLLIAEKLIECAETADRVVTHRNAVTALEYLEQCIHAEGERDLPDAILLDIGMPVLDGFDFLNRLEELYLEIIPDVYIMTVSIYPPDREKAARCKMVKGFIIKPLTLDQVKNL